MAASESLERQILSLIQTDEPLTKDIIPDHFLHADNVLSIITSIRNALNFFCDVQSQAAVSSLGNDNKVTSIAIKERYAVNAADSKCSSTPKTKPCPQKSLFNQSSTDKYYKFEKRIRKSNRSHNDGHHSLNDSLMLSKQNSDTSQLFGHRSKFNISSSVDFPSLLNDSSMTEDSFMTKKIETSNTIQPRRIKPNFVKQKNSTSYNSSFAADKSLSISDSSVNYSLNTVHLEKENRVWQNSVTEMNGSKSDKLNNYLSGKSIQHKQFNSKKKSRRIKPQLISSNATNYNA
jgi:hypothetical protein